MMVCHIRLQNGLPVWSRSLSGSRCDMFFNGTLLMGEMDVETSDILDIDGNIIEVQRGYRTNNMMLRIVCIWVTYAQFMAIFTRKMMIQPSNFGIYPMFRQTKLVSLKFLQYPPQVYAHIPR